MSFSPKQFRQSLLDSSKLAKNFQKYLNQCKKNNVQVIYYMVQQFQKIMFDKQNLILKVNVVYAIQLCLETCEYPFVEMTQAFLLPVIQQVALYMSDKRTYGKTSQFSKEKGYPASTPNVEQLSHNYVTLATNLVFLASKIKPNYYFFIDKLNMDSAFKQLADKLVKKGNQISSDIEKKGQKLNQVYQQKIAQFQNFQEEYVDFFRRKIQKYLLQGGKGRQYLDIRKLLKNLDSWLTSEIIGSLHDALENNNFQVRRHALGLLNEIFIWGDIEAIMVLNEGDSVENIYQRIIQVKGSSDLGRGGQIYPQINGQLQNKKNFYIDFLRYLQTWSKLVPTSIYLNNEQQSKISVIYRKLKDKNFIFPSNEMFAKLKKQFDQNMKKNEDRNNYIVTQLNDNQNNSSKNRSSYASFRLSKYSNKISLIKEMRQSTILNLQEIQKLIEECQTILKNITLNQRELAKNMKTLTYFSNQFQKKFSMIEEEITQSRLQSLYQRGYRCLQKINGITPQYKEYQNASLTFKEFSQNIRNICKIVDTNKSNISGALSKLKSKSKHSISRNSLSKSGLQLSKSGFIKTKDKQQQNILKLKQSMEKNDFVLEKSNSKSPQFMKEKQKISKLSDNSSMSKDQQKGQKKGMNSNSFNNKKQRISQKLQIEVNTLSKANMKIDDKRSIDKKSSKQESSVSEVSNSYNAQNSFQKRFQNGSNNSNANKDKQSQPSSNSNKNKQEKASMLKHQRSSFSNRKDIVSPPQKKVQKFSEDSWSSQSQEEKEQKKADQKQKIKQFNEKKKSKQKQFFQASSFSNYNQEHQQIRDAISKQQNPSFKMVFKQKVASKMSKNSKIQKSIQSSDYHMAVLQSLAPKSINEQTHKDFSHLSRQKSGFIQPLKTNKAQFSSKIQNRLQMNEFNKSKESRMEFEDSSYNEATNTYDYKTKINRQQQQSNSMNKKSPSNSESNNFQIVQQGSNDERSSESKKFYKFEKPMNRFRQSNSYNQINTLSSNHQNNKKQLQKHLIYEVNNGKNQKHYNDYQRKVQDQDLKHLQSIKTHKLNEIKRLQQKIVKLKQQSYKFQTRSNWQSPHRGSPLRTGLSPRFRNNTITNNTLSDNHDQVNSYRHQFALRKRTTQQMNFDVVDLFKSPEGRLIYTRLYKKQLSQLNIKQKRKILKGKDLVFRNDDIQIGLLLHRQAKDLKIIYYITANKFIKTFLYKIQQTNKLAINAIPKEISYLQPKKQYRIYIFSQILQFPYKMPTIIFKYHPQLLPVQQKLFVRNQINLITSLIPFFFIKFITMTQVTDQYYQTAWNNGNNILRGEEIAYSQKIIPKHFYILQYFPQMINLQTKEYQSIYAVQCQFGSTKFILKVVLKINKFMYIQGVLTNFREKNNSEKILEYSICCINELLSKTNRDEFI